MNELSVNDFDVWQNEIPIVIVGIDGEFDVWQNGAPVEDVDKIVARRRTFEF